jgi:uncharacterized membrane protein
MKEKISMATKSDSPVDLYVAAYSDENAAQRDWNGVKQLARDGAIDLDGLVLVRRDPEGKIQVRDDAHDVRKGTVIGAVGGAVVGLIFPPSILMGGAVGAGIGAGIGKLRSHRTNKEIRSEVEDVLPPDSSGIVALFEERWGPDMDRALEHADKVTKHDVDKQSAEDVKAAATSGKK